MTSTRRLAVLIIAALAVSLGAPAQAAPSRSSSEHGEYEHAGGWTHSDCQDDASCDATWSATTQGAATATVEYSQQDPTPGVESTSGHAGIRHTLQLPHKARSAEVRLVWKIKEAASGATPRAGRAFTGTYVHARAWCGGKCKTEPVQAQVTYCGVEPTRPACDPLRATATNRDVALTLTLTELTSRFVQITTEAAAFAGGRRGCFLVRSDGTCELETPDDKHAGSAASSVDAELTHISIASSG